MKLHSNELYPVKENIWRKLHQNILHQNIHLQAAYIPVYKDPFNRCEEQLYWQFIDVVHSEITDILK